MTAELLNQLLEALRPFADQMISDDSMCHRGLCSAEECCRCSKILKARAAIAAGEAYVPEAGR
jgi:hypothetical protein